MPLEVLANMMKQGITYLFISYLPTWLNVMPLEVSANMMKQGIANTLALSIDKMLYINLLCPHSEDPKNTIPI
jgi:hypothetical protein